MTGVAPGDDTAVAVVVACDASVVGPKDRCLRPGRRSWNQSQRVAAAVVVVVAVAVDAGPPPRIT